MATSLCPLLSLASKEDRRRSEVHLWLGVEMSYNGSSDMKIYEPSKSATAGRFQSRGEDLVQYLGDDGDIVAGLDFNGSLHVTDVVANGVSLSDLATEVQQIIISGLPSVINCGTF